MGSPKAAPPAGFDATCRICGRDEGPTINLFGEEGRKRQLLTKIRFCFSKQVLQVSPKDGLPKGICEECQQALSNSYCNAKKIHQLQIVLKEKYANKKVCLQNQAAVVAAAAAAAWDVDRAVATRISEPPPAAAPGRSVVSASPQRPCSLELTLQDIFSDDRDDEARHSSSSEDNPSDLLLKSRAPSRKKKAFLKESTPLLSTPESDQPPPLPCCTTALSLPTLLTTTTATCGPSAPLVHQRNAELLLPHPSILLDQPPGLTCPPSSSTHVFQTDDEATKPVPLLSHGGGHFRCMRCNLGFKDDNLCGGASGAIDVQSSAVVKHCINVHSTMAMIFQCPTCLAAFATTSGVDDHMKVHVDEEGRCGSDAGLQCATCHLHLASRSSLKAHIQAVHFASGLVHECVRCSKLFSSKATLKRHQLTHCHGQEPQAPAAAGVQNTASGFSCGACHAPFSHKSILMTHLRTHHTGDSAADQLSCPVCGLGFKHKAALHSHILICQTNGAKMLF